MNSAAFRAQLPTDGRINFSALVYYNLATAVAPLAEQLKASGILPAEQQAALDQFSSNREPTLIYAYGEIDRISVASRGNFFGFNLDTLVGLSGSRGISIPQLMRPVLPGGGAARRQKQAVQQ